MQDPDETWILARLATSDDPSLRAVRRVRCVPLRGASTTSRPFRIELDPPPPGSPQLFLKRYGTTQPDVEVYREAAGLEWLEAQGFGSESTRTPRVLAFDSERRALLLTFHAGESLLRRLHHTLALARVNRGAADRTIMLAGRLGHMLAALQALPVPPHLRGTTAETAVMRYAADMERRLARLAAAGVHVGRLLQKWMEAMGTLTASPPRLQHSDFGPWNLLVGPGESLVLFDFHNLTAGHPIYDLAYMHLALEGTRRLQLMHAPTVERTQRALLDGYREGGGGLDLPALRAFRIMHVAYFAHPLVSRRRSSRLLLYGARNGRRYAARWIERITTAQPES